MDVHLLMTKLTLINCAEEKIEEQTNKERVHRHLPTEIIKSNDDITFTFNTVK